MNFLCFVTNGLWHHWLIRACFLLRTRNSLRGFVRPLVRRSVGPSVCNDRVGKCEKAHFRPCPPVRNWWPCIQPYSLHFLLRLRSAVGVSHNKIPFDIIFSDLESCHRPFFRVRERWEGERRKTGKKERGERLEDYLRLKVYGCGWINEGL